MIAAVTYALWIPNILLTSQFWQEHLFVPLTVVGLAWFGRALRTRSLRDWTAAGIFLGAAALTRSSVGYRTAFFGSCSTSGCWSSPCGPARVFGLRSNLL